MDAHTIINLILGAVTLFFAVKWGLVKGKLGEAAGLLKVVKESLEDDKLTAAEWDAIKQAFKKLLSK